MVGKKEVQDKIIKKEEAEISKEEELLKILKVVAPGTNLRAGIDGALKSGRGALIVIENEHVPEIIEGGFRINARFTPQRMIELCKMDGAIVLSKDIKKIDYANVLLTPDSKIKTVETGTRHKAAERTAKQTETIVIAISERKNLVTVYGGKVRYGLENTDDILRKTNENIQMIEKHRASFDENIRKLNSLELRNLPSMIQAMSVIQKGTMIQKISKDMRKYIIELGNEGTLLKTRLKETTGGVEKETDLVIKDYTKVDVKKSKYVLESLNYEELLDKSYLLSALGYEGSEHANSPEVKGWRLLSKTSLPEADVALLIKEVGSLGKAIHSGTAVHETIFGQEKARVFRDELNKIKIGY
jgi:diadenylate cyclase